MSSLNMSNGFNEIGGLPINKKIGLFPRGIPLILQIIMIITVASVYVISPYWNGLYFVIPTEQFSIGIIFVSLIFLVWLYKSHIDIKLNKFYQTYYLYFGILGFVYIIDSLWSPAQSEFAVEGVIRFISIAGLLLVLSIMFRSLAAKKLFLLMILITGSWTSLLGLGSIYGTFHYNGAIMEPNRVASVFQYANTNAAFSATVLLISFFIYSLIESILLKVLVGVGSYIMLLNIALSFSRGTWITLIILSVAMLFVIPKSQRFRLILINIAPIVSFFLTLSYQIKADEKRIQSAGWISLSFGIVLTTLFVFVICKWFEKRSISIKIPKWLIWPLVIVCLAVGAIVLYKVLGHSSNNSFVDRIKNISLKDHSVLERLIYYKDALRMFFLHPILGSGYNAWQVCFPKYQSFPYFSKHEHSYLMQLLVETGSVGTLSFVAAIVFYVKAALGRINIKNESDNNVQYEQSKIVTLISLFVVAAIIFHAVIDFDMSYSFMNYYLWGIIALGVPSINFEKKSSGIKKVPLAPSKSIIYVAGIILMLILLIIDIGAVTANSFVNNSSNERDPGSKLKDLESARSLAGYNSKIALSEAQVADQVFMQTQNADYGKQALTFANDSVKLAPFDSQNLLIASQVSYKYGQFQQALNYGKQAYQNNKYSIQTAEQYMVYLIFEAERAIKTDPKLVKEYALLTKDVWNNVNDLDKDYNNLPPYLPPEEKFAITDQMKLRAAEAYAILGDSNNAEQLLDGLVSSKDSYIASAAKMVKNVLIEKHIIKGNGYDIQSLINSNKSLTIEYNLLLLMAFN